MPQVEKRANNRLIVLLDAAANQFASKGYHGTTIRSISQKIDMRPGSIYYHFDSKAELLIAVYEEGVKRITNHVTKAVGQHSDPWNRLEAAVGAHLESVLDKSDYARVLISVLPDEAKEIEGHLKTLRSNYETIFIDLVAHLTLRPGIDPTLFRLLILGAINWAPVWFRQNSGTPLAVAKEFISILRNGGDGNAIKNIG